MIQAERKAQRLAAEDRLAAEEAARLEVSCHHIETSKIPSDLVPQCEWQQTKE